MHFLFAILCSVFGIAAGGLTQIGGAIGGVVGALLGIMAAEILVLRSRVRQLEKQQVEVREHPAPEREHAVSEVEHEVVEPEITEQVPPRIASSEAETVHSDGWKGVPGWYDQLYGVILSFISGGNLVLKAGVIVLFFGIAFLLKYAVQHSMISEELRLIGAASGAVVLLLVGWRLRVKRPGYAVTLQGAGVGTLYLVVFAAGKLYHLLPIPLSLGLMVGLVCLSSILAVLQDARSLAVFGSLGGFAAPVLLSSGGGNHVLLFSYFSLLNVGILIIAWFKSWRVLNIIGFISTFVIGSLWGYQGYRPEHFLTTEPFLVFFTLLYIAVSVLFAHRQPIRLKGLVDTTLVFGVPLTAISLQYLLVRDFQYGMALSMLTLGLVYLLIALLLIRKKSANTAMLTEAFLALGIAFGSLSVPFAVDSKWTSTTWALEGGALVWVGIRQKRIVGVLFGLLLQVGAGIGFVMAVWYPFEAILFVNRHFIGCLLIAGSALFSCFYLGRTLQDFKWKRMLQTVRYSLLFWGLLWWYYGGYREMVMHAPAYELNNAMLLYTCGSIIALGMIAKRYAWKDLARSLLLLLPVMTLTLLVQLDRPLQEHFLSGWGALSWPTAMIIQYRLLRHFEDMWPLVWAKAWHLVTMWLLMVLLCNEVQWLWSQTPGFSPIWGQVCWGGGPAVIVFLLLRWGTLLAWPVARHKEVYLGWGIRLPALWMIIWVVITFTFTADPEPASYIPVLNPLEMTQLVILLVLLYTSISLTPHGKINRMERATIWYWSIGLLAFGWLNSIIARTIHFYHGVRYGVEPLYNSVVFQAAIAALWGGTALAITVTATRREYRPLWFAGSVLLALVVGKLFIIDLSGSGTVARIVSFLVVGVLMLIIGYFAPLPPKEIDKA